MVLKDAFRYQNYLSTLEDQAKDYLRSSNLTMKTTEEHYRNKVNPEAKDEIVEVSGNIVFNFSADDTISFLCDLIAEKEKVSYAIGSAKRSCEFDIDSEIAINRVRQNMVGLCDSLCKKKPSERIVTGYDYKFNAEGNQSQYQYEVKHKEELAFDRDSVKRIARDLRVKSDEISSEIDRMMATVTVNHSPRYVIGDTFDDAIEMFMSGNQ